MNILADECVYKVTVALFRSWGHDVLTTQDVGLAGKPEEEILAYAIQHERVENCDALILSMLVEILKITDCLQYKQRCVNRI
jgi:hypothetical protein